MASTIFHHWLDQYRALPAPHKRRLHAGLWVLAFVAVFAAGVLLGHALGFRDSPQARVRALASRNATLQNQVQSLAQQQRTASATIEGLRKSLAERDDALQKLQQDQAMYSKLIGIDANRSGLGMHSIALTPVSGTNAWNFVVTLVNAAEHADPARGTVTLAVEGVRNGKLASLGWASLSGPANAAGLPYAFKFFQQLHGSVALPAGFVPNRVVVTVHPKGGAAITRAVDWKAALASDGDADTP